MRAVVDWFLRKDAKWESQIKKVRQTSTPTLACLHTFTPATPHIPSIPRPCSQHDNSPACVAPSTIMRNTYTGSHSKLAGISITQPHNTKLLTPWTKYLLKAEHTVCHHYRRSCGQNITRWHYRAILISLFFTCGASAKTRPLILVLC